MSHALLDPSEDGQNVAALVGVRVLNLDIDEVILGHHHAGYTGLGDFAEDLEILPLPKESGRDVFVCLEAGVEANIGTTLDLDLGEVEPLYLKAVSLRLSSTEGGSISDPIRKTIRFPG